LVHEKDVIIFAIYSLTESMLLWMEVKGARQMADRKAYRRAGRISGAVYAAHRAKGQGVTNFLVETASGAFGGDVGALAADWLEPATSSWHRGTAHSCAAGGVILSLGEVLAGVETYCRQQADQKAAERKTLQTTQDPAQPNLFVATPNSSLTQLWLTICELFWRAVTGFVNGLTAGYISHLVLDAGTARSIPLLTNGF
jgi:hypothetical protein